MGVRLLSGLRVWLVQMVRRNGPNTYKVSPTIKGLATHYGAEAHSFDKAAKLFVGTAVIWLDESNVRVLSPPGSDVRRETAVAVSPRRHMDKQRAQAACHPPESRRHRSASNGSMFGWPACEWSSTCYRIKSEVLSTCPTRQTRAGAVRYRLIAGR